MVQPRMKWVVPVEISELSEIFLNSTTASVGSTCFKCTAQNALCKIPHFLHTFEWRTKWAIQTQPQSNKTCNALKQNDELVLMHTKLQIMHLTRIKHNDIVHMHSQVSNSEKCILDVVRTHMEANSWEHKNWIPSASEVEGTTAQDTSANSWEDKCKRYTEV